VALSQSINQENGIHNIRSCCICPGEVATDILKNRPEPVPQEDIERLLQPEDLAAMALFVATMPERANITEMLVTPTYMRLLAPQAKKIAAMSSRRAGLMCRRAFLFCGVPPHGQHPSRYGQCRGA
jgi:NAD(P)-dependent dehydrogenase (short-subunit alcohol dehydrogenase family)